MTHCDVLPSLQVSIELPGLGLTVVETARGGLEVVSASGPAQQAGIQAHDLLTGVGGQRVTSVAELQEAVAALRPGVACAIGIQRDGQPAVVSIMPTKHVREQGRVCGAARGGGWGVCAKPCGGVISTSNRMESNGIKWNGIEPIPFTVNYISHQKMMYHQKGWHNFPSWHCSPLASSQKWFLHVP